MRAALRDRNENVEGAISDLRRLNDLTGTLETHDALTLAEALLKTGDVTGAERSLRLANLGASDASDGQKRRIEALEKALKERAEQ